MDRDELDKAIDRWLEAEIIDDEAARQIRAIEAGVVTPDDPTEVTGLDRRLIEIISLMGSALVGAGALLLLWTYWGDLGTASRSVIVILAPSLVGGLGVWLRRKHFPRVGFALWFLGVLLLGPMFILLMDMHVPEFGVEVPLLLWAVCAIPAGHVVRSRLTTAIGIVVLLTSVAVASQTEDATYVLAMTGVLIIGAGFAVRRSSSQLAAVYQLVGVIPVIGGLLFIGIQRGDVETIQPSFEPLLLGLLLGGLVIGLVVAIGYSRDVFAVTDMLMVEVSLFASILGLGLVMLTPPIPAMASFLLVHAVLLVALLTLVGVGLVSKTRSMINLVVVAFLAQVLTFLLTTLGDALPGSIALVITGVILLTVGLFLERGRRRILDRFE